MRYRLHPGTGQRQSEIGLGTAYLTSMGQHRAVELLTRAFAGGINFYDLAAAEAGAFEIFGAAFAGSMRREVQYQIHFGADYSSGAYGFSLNLEKVRRSVTWQLEKLKTDYIDFGFIHCQDEFRDWERYQERGILDYLLTLKAQGVVRHLGLSSHTPEVASRILTDVKGEIKLLMFSINPAYDYGQGEYAHGGVEERAALYRRCARDKVGITVMKAFCGGQLLDARLSPFKQALSVAQCLKYALDKPAVLTVIAGAQSLKELEVLLNYDQESDEALDYSVIGSFAPPEAHGKCVYCNHCRPCPRGLNVGLINKYYDLAMQGDELAREHYRSLEHRAMECDACGHCDRRCPFGVMQSERMHAIAAHLG